MICISLSNRVKCPSWSVWNENERSEREWNEQVNYIYIAEDNKWSRG